MCLATGETFLYWYGTEARVFISEPEQAKEVLSNKFSFYPKPKPRPTIAALLGKGLVFVEGLDWVRHRRAVSPAFNIDKLKVTHPYVNFISLFNTLLLLLLLLQKFNLFLKDGSWVCLIGVDKENGSLYFVHA